MDTDEIAITVGDGGEEKAGRPSSGTENESGEVIDAEVISAPGEEEKSVPVAGTEPEAGSAAEKSAPHDNCGCADSGKNAGGSGFLRRLFRRRGKNTDGAPAAVAVEYQPDALEIKYEKLPWFARLGVWSAFIFMLLAVIWASLSEVDIIVNANGKLITDTPNIVMKPLELTVIKSIDVKVGEPVRKGQVLITFEPVFNQAELDRISAELSTLGAQYNRLLAEFEGREYVAEDPSNKDQQWQLAIAAQRSQFYKEKIRYYDQSIEQLESSYRTTQDSLSKQTERLGKISEIEKMYVTLIEKKAAALKDMLEIQIQRMELESTVDQLRNSLIEQTHSIETAKASKNSYVEEWRNGISEELVSVRRDYTAAQKAYDKANMQVHYDCLRAPCPAIVHEIAAFSPGSAVREAEALITLVPLTNEIELEAEIPAMDIGRVNIGDTARVKLSSFPFQKHGTLDGWVRTISRDVFQRQQGEQGAASYYRARIVLSGREKLRNMRPGQFRLIPGMECQAEIKVGRRRIIEYLVHPLIKALDESMREP